ncbi:hypothetical protein MXD61_06920 [Frankia sp. AgPm24]|uniref:hypothetical protein n=1 Tax=Frankia sp. AgPm24 TaxID=631128 RepID=UPI00200D4147|nr:hypothetical protein [Frankia sp. AgPm24]MCK9921623.1 hypothetical protein [Frankia sp. AgPm24]
MRPPEKNPRYWTATDHVRHWAATHLSADTVWDTALMILLAAVAAVPTATVATVAATAGQPPGYAAVTAGAGLALAAAAAWEARARRRADARLWPVVPGLVGPALLAAWCTLLTTSPHALGRGLAPALLGLWPTACALGAAAIRLSRPATQPAQESEPVLSRSEPDPEPSAQTSEPQVSDPPAELTKTAQLLALAAAVPSEDPRRPTRLAADLATQVGMNPDTARRILATARRAKTTAAA